MTPISKEEFMVILKRQQESGLSVKDFCKINLTRLPVFITGKVSLG